MVTDNDIQLKKLKSEIVIPWKGSFHLFRCECMDGQPDQCTASSEKTRQHCNIMSTNRKDNLYDICIYVEETGPKGLARVCLCKKYCMKQPFVVKEDTVTNEIYKQIKNSDSFQQSLKMIKSDSQLLSRHNGSELNFNVSEKPINDSVYVYIKCCRARVAPRKMTRYVDIKHCWMDDKIKKTWWLNYLTNVLW